MIFNPQPNHLENELVKLIPIKPDDFEQLYQVASDPKIWEQHPNPDRYKREVFENFFSGAINSKGAFLVIEAKTEKVAGSSRYYDIDPENSSIAIGYTFLARNHWGGTFNRALKTLMLNYAFEHVDTVIFHIGATNIRSQTAIKRLRAEKFDEVEMSYYGEPAKLNFVYRIKKENWI